MTKDELRQMIATSITTHDPTPPADLRDRLVAVAREWQRWFGIEPSITSALSELEAARLVGMSDADYAKAMHGVSKVRGGLDFSFEGVRYQVKGSYDSGRLGSTPTRVAAVKPRDDGSYGWDRLVWIHYAPDYSIRESWRFDADSYRRIVAPHYRANGVDTKLMRQGTRLA